MATNQRAKRAAQEPAEAKKQPNPKLRATDTEGVFLNEFNVPVDEDGIALKFSALKRIDRAKLYEVNDESVDSPAKLLKAIALDPRQPMYVRIDAAHKAAPYFDRKAPIGIDGGLSPNGDVKPLNLSALDGMSRAELTAALALLAKLGVNV